MSFIRIKLNFCIFSRAYIFITLYKHPAGAEVKHSYFVLWLELRAVLTTDIKGKSKFWEMKTDTGYKPVSYEKRTNLWFHWTKQLLLRHFQAAQAARGILPEMLGGGAGPTSQNPYSIHDQNPRYSLPYLWPDQNFDTLFMTIAANTEQYLTSERSEHKFISSRYRVMSSLSCF